MMIELTRDGRQIVVRRNVEHPEQYLWIHVGDRKFFLGVLEPHMRRRDVRAMAERWLQRHPNY